MRNTFSTLPIVAHQLLAYLICWIVASSFLFPLTSFANPQRIEDSLLNLLHEHPQQDTARLRLLSQLSEEYKSKRNILKLLGSSNELLLLSLSLNDKIGLIDANLYLGDVYYYSNGRMSIQDLVVEAQPNYSLSAYKLAESISDYPRMILALKQMYGLTGERKYFDEALKIANDKAASYKPMLYSAFIVIYLISNSPKDSLPYYVESFHASNKANPDHFSTMSLYLRLGKYYLLSTKEKEKGFSYLDSVAQMASTQNYFIQNKYYSILGEYYLSIKDVKLAIKNFEEALFYAKKSEIQSDIISCYDALGNTYQLSGDERNMHKYNMLSYNEQKSYTLDLRRRLLQNIAFEEKFENQYLQNDDLLKKQKNQLSAIYIISIVLILATGLFIFFFYHYRRFKRISQLLRHLNNEIKEKNLKIEQNLSELEEIVQERTQKVREQNEQLLEIAYYNSHQVRGPLARIMGLLYLYKENIETDKEKILKLITISSEELDQHVAEINKKLTNSNTNES